MTKEFGPVLKMNREHLTATNIILTLTVLNVNGPLITLILPTSNPATSLVL